MDPEEMERTDACSQQMDRRQFVKAASAVLAVSATSGSVAFSQEAPAGSTAINVDTSRTIGPLPHFWERAAGSDRTVVGLREQWRQDLVRVQKDTGIQSIRCHGLFNDEMGVAQAGPGNFNFLYVDQIYDFMLDHGVRPFVELSFMPESFATSANRIFACKGNV